MGVVSLVRVEMRRALHRRTVWALMAAFVALSAVIGLVIFVEASRTPLSELRAEYPHPAAMADWWIAGSLDGSLLMAGVPMLLGGLLGGATLAGAEWRAGTVAMALTWEPRRVRLHVARTFAAFVLATVIAFVLLALFLAAKVPVVVAHGTVEGVDGAWWWGLVGAMGRIALLAGLAAVLGVALATLGRNTVFALGAAFGWMAVGEALVRLLRPSVQHHLVAENVAGFLAWAPLPAVDAAHPAGGAAALLGAYVTVLVVIGAVAFARRDIAAAG
jgi:hypothetical protein